MQRKWIEYIERAKSAFLLEAQQATLVNENDVQQQPGAQPKAPPRNSNANANANKAAVPPRRTPASTNPFDDEEQPLQAGAGTLVLATLNSEVQVRIHRCWFCVLFAFLINFLKYGPSPSGIRLFYEL